nr:hypothetical protein [Natronorubrum halophilum]
MFLHSAAVGKAILTYIDEQQRDKIFDKHGPPRGDAEYGYG